MRRLTGRHAGRGLAWSGRIGTALLGWAPACVPLLALPALVVGLAAPALAKQCPYCLQEIADDVNELRCPNCIELAQKITRGNEQIWVLDFQPGKLRPMQIKDDTGDVETFLILDYTLTNKDDVPHPFFIDITAWSDRVRHPHKTGLDEDLFFVPTPRPFAFESSPAPGAAPSAEPPHDWSKGPGPQLKGTARYHDVWISDAYEEARKVLGVREGEELLSQRELCMPPEGETNVMPNKDINSTAEGQVALRIIKPNQTLRCVAIFRGIDAETDGLSVFVRGLTNSSILQHADYVRPPDRPHERVITEAILVLSYSRPGDEFAHGLDPIKYLGRRWTDQTRTIKSDLKSLPPGDKHRVTSDGLPEDED